MDIFEGKLYTLPINRKPDHSDKTLIKKILEKEGHNISLDYLKLIKTGEDYDLFFIRTDDKFYSLKLSLDGDNKSLKRELDLVKKLDCESVPSFVGGGNITVGDKLFYLLCETHPSEPVTDYGIGCLSEGFTKFLKDYSDLYNSRPSNYSFKQQTKDFIESLDLGNLFSGDEVKHIDSNSDYLKCRNIISNLSSEVLNLVNKIDYPFSNNIIADIDTSYIFYNGLDFQFFDLKNCCRGHVFSDLANISLTLGFSKDSEKDFVTKSCSELNIEYDQNLFSTLYNLELRKKALKLFVCYLKEIYLYESQRIEEIFKITQEFTKSYETYCKIPIIKENRHFIFKPLQTQTEGQNSYK